MSNTFSAEIMKIGINPFVFLPEETLKIIFKQAGKEKGKIPVRIRIDGHEFTQTLIKYAGHWRLYLNTPMRKSANKDVGDFATFEVNFDPIERKVPMHPKMIKALEENAKAKTVYDNLSPSRQKEIAKYLFNLKTEESVDRNVVKAINFLLGKGRFVGRDRP